MERKASCSCGQLSIRVKGEPKIVAACSCLKCQKRTGSVFGVSSYFDDDQVIERIGESNSYERTSDSGLKVERKFCPICGSTVYWKADILDKYTGVAVGAFADPEFPEPTFSAWNKSKHSWVSFPENWKSSDTQEFDLSLD